MTNVPGAADRTAADHLAPLSTATPDADRQETLITDALEAAHHAARSSQVAIRELSDTSDLEQVYALYDGIWHPEPRNPPVTTELLRALAHAGNYVTGAFSDGILTAACVGVFASPASQSMHSHVAGVSPLARGRNVGFALKLHQRAWALQRNVTRIEWTFDPLVRRNAHFNLNKLGASPTDYLLNFYGRMADEINGGDDSDRMLVSWALDAQHVVQACQTEHVAESASADLRTARAVVGLGIDERNRAVVGSVDGPLVLVCVPADIERLRVEDPDAARAWRAALRDVLYPLVKAGAVVRGFSRQGGYIVERKQEWS